MGPRRRLLPAWRDKGLTAEFHDRLRDRVRQAAGRDTEPTAGIIDAQSVKAAASVPAVTRGFDGGKKVNGRKRHIVVDVLGLLLAVMVTAASVTDREAGQTLLARLRGRHWRVTRVWADGGYTGRLVDLTRDAWRIALTVVRRSNDTSGFTVLPKRWLVERTFAWLMHSRRLARNYETRTDMSEAVIKWAMSTVMSRPPRPAGTIRPGRTAATHATAPAPRPCPGGYHRWLRHPRGVGPMPRGGASVPWRGRRRRGDRPSG
ncbi:IS5 family transposase [Streptomyces werraensis]|uniref:IS5 family transposase n=1 Tax=Streptomyces werraensis TaxID=68284 RepID=UPI001CE361C5